MHITTVQVIDLPQEIEQLKKAALAEGFDFVRTMIEEFQSGTNRLINQVNFY